MPDRRQTVVYSTQRTWRSGGSDNGNDAEPARDLHSSEYSLQAAKQIGPPTEAAIRAHREEPPFGQAGVSTDPSTQPRSCDGRTKLLS